MNDLLPPQRRSIPEHRRIRMRDELENEMHTTSRRDSRLRRFGIPIVAAAAVVGLAVGGYAVLGGNGTGLSPTGTTTKTPKPTPTVTLTPQPTPPPKPTPTPTKKETKQAEPLAKPSQAYRSCINLVRNAGQWIDNPPRNLSGKLAVDNGKGITVVVANGSDAYTCNIKPDSAVSHPRPLDSGVSQETFAVANNYTGNVIPGDNSDMVWGGGALPNGVTSITYAFPNGDQEQAVIKDGFWVMQYFSVEPFAEIGEPVTGSIKVKLDGSGGERELTLRWGDHTCNQVSHGC
jgi:hypothetical protein